MKPIGPTFGREAIAAGLPDGFSFGVNGIIECHDVQNNLVKIWKDDAGTVCETRAFDHGTHAQLSEQQITAIKNCRASHDHTQSYIVTDCELESRYDCLMNDIKALGLVMLDEINAIRGASAATISGMTDRTEAQMRTAWVRKRSAL